MNKKCTNYYNKCSLKLETIALVLAKPLIDIPFNNSICYVERDLLNQLPSLPKIDDWACLVWLYMVWVATVASTNFYWHIETVWD